VLPSPPSGRGSLLEQLGHELVVTVALAFVVRAVIIRVATGLADPHRLGQRVTSGDSVTPLEPPDMAAAPEVLELAAADRTVWATSAG
jgi:hypothetical protein